MQGQVDATDPRLEPYRHVGDAAWLQSRGLFVAAGRLEQVTGFDFHRGCLALAHRPAVQDEGVWLARGELVLVLDGIGNPDNVGGLFRTAAALGADGVLVTGTTADPLYRKSIRTSM